MSRKEAPANVIVFYVNVDDMSIDEIGPYIEKVREAAKIDWEGTETIYLPVRKDSTRIEVMHLQPPHDHWNH